MTLIKNKEAFPHLRQLKIDKGFTLIEVLIATTILVMACLLTVKISTQVLDAWARAEKNSSNEIETHLALNIMEEDLETAFPQFWVYNENNSNKTKNDIQLSFYSYGRNGNWQAISYQIGLDKKTKKKGLYRHAQEINDDIKQLKHLPQPQNLIKIPSNLLVSDIVNFSVNFLYKDKEGSTQWSFNEVYEGSAISAEISIELSKSKTIKKRVTFMATLLHQ